MKVALSLLLVLPFVFCAPQQRFIEPFVNSGSCKYTSRVWCKNFVDIDILKCDVQLMIDDIGSDPKEAQCESECHKLLQQGHIFNYGCPLVCHGFQNLAHLWHITPDTTICSKMTNATTVSA